QVPRRGEADPGRVQRVSGIAESRRADSARRGRRPAGNARSQRPAWLPGPLDPPEGDARKLPVSDRRRANAGADRPRGGPVCLPEGVDSEGPGTVRSGCIALRRPEPERLARRRGGDLRRHRPGAEPDAAPGAPYVANAAPAMDAPRPCNGE